MAPRKDPIVIDSPEDVNWMQLGGQPAAPQPQPQPQAAAPQPASPAGDKSGSGRKQEFINRLMPAAIEVSKRTGVDPRIIVAQAAQETGWGKSAPGNNFFGIKSHGKGGGQNLQTQEVIGGKRVTINDSFRRFNSPEDSVLGYGEFITQNPRYRAFRSAEGLEQQAAALQASGYATDPNYGRSVLAIAQSIPFPDGTPLPRAASGTGSVKRDPVIIDESFEPQDGFGLYRGKDNPFLALKPATQTAPVEIPQADNSQAEAQLAELQKRDSQRYEMVPADKVEQWQAQWQSENASTGLMGDTKRLLQAGWAGLGTAAREVVGAIPVVGPKLQAAGDAVDEWLYGAADGALYERQLDQAIAGLTPETAQSREKNWWDSENGRLGPAWSDPRSYFAGVVESLPGTVITMGPSMALARGGFLKAMAAGASRKEAAAIAARNALLAGAIGEGLLSGGQVSAAVRQQIGAMTEAQLASSEAVKTLMESGLSLQESIAAVTDDAATQSMIIGGVASGLFSGLGDRTLAKILAEGVGGGIVKRIVSGAGRGAVGEGLLEEAPQEAAQQIAQNIGVRTVDPSRDILQDVPEAMAGGLAIGGAMGAGMGGVGGAARPATTDGAGAASDDVLDVEMVQEPAPAQQPAPKKGPLSKAVERGLDGRQLPRVMIADPAVGDMAAGPLDGSIATIADDQRNVAPGMRRVILDDGQAHIIGQNLLVPVAEAGAAPVNTAPDGAPPIGANVRIDLPGADPVMARVESYEDGEAVIMDPGTGEIYQVPVDALTVIPERPMPGQAAPAPELPPVDLATMPGEPIPAEVRTSEPAPARDTAPVQEVLWNAPAPGQRAILTTPDGTRESVTIASYERDSDASAREALVRRADGTEVQVPVAALEVSKVLPSEQEKRDLKENPPVERETITGTNALAREVFGAQIVLPDERHARLYDLGKNRRDSKQILRTSQLDLDRAMPAEQEKLAEEFGVSPQRLGQIADDYRYRVERAAKQARSRTPVQMYPANENLIGRMQAEDRREAAKTARAAEPEPVPASVTDGALPDIWDRLPLPERTRLLEAAKVKRAPKTKWEALTPQIREKLVNAHQAPKAPEVAAPAVEASAPAAVSKGESTPAVPDAPEAAASNIETEVDAAANEAATSPANDLPEPTPAQKEAGNYKVGRIRLSGLDISIENPAGSVRSGTDSDGETWSITMQSHYGYLRGTIGRDGDHIDVFVKPGLENIDGLPVVVVDQVAPDGSFDEHKVMLGFPSQEEAEAAYLANYTRGWKLGPVSTTTLDRFKDWLENGKTRLKASARANNEFFGAEQERARVPQGREAEQAPLPAQEKIKKAAAPASQKTDAPASPRPVRSPQQNFRENYAMSGSADLRSNPDLIEVADYADWLGSLSDAQWKTIGDRFTNLENPYLNAGVIDTASARAKLESALAVPAAETAESARAAPAVSENTIFTSDAAAAAREVLRRKLGQLNTGIDPEVMQAGITLAGYHIERGARTFAAYAAAMLRDLGETARPYLKSWYMGVKYDPRASALDGMSSAAEVDAADINTLEAETDDVSGTPDTVEPDRPGPENAVDQETGQPDGLPDVRGAERALDAAVAEGRARQPDSVGLPDAGPLDAGAQGNQRAPRAERERGSAPGTAGTADARGNRRDSAGRVQSERQAGARLRQKAERRSESLTKRQQQQAAADKVPVVLMDADNIAATLPLLSNSQHGDVLRTEQRLYRDGGKGKMLTNGTGTGKTYSGLGVAKRVIRRGGNVLIVAPAGVLTAWEKGARDLQMEPHRLTGKKDAGGAGLNLTSFQNFRDNQELVQRNFAFVIYDESHHLMANMSGDSTAASVAHKALTGHPEFAETRGRLAIQADYDAYHADETREVKKFLARGVPPERAAREVAERPEFEARRKDMAQRASKISARLADEQARVNTKVLFLSASPFAGHKSVFYADGYLFDSRDGASTSQAYNTGSPEAQYLAANFGYRMRYNRANTPGPEVDIGVLERDWADRMFQSGAMTGRKIELDHDYSREFVVVEPGAGSAIDRAFQAINWKDYPKLAQQVIEWRKGGSDRQLTEALRARGALDRIAKHLALGRKVVVFHERQQLNITNPFDFKATDDATRAEIEKLRAAEPWIFGIDLSGLKPVPAAIGERFGDQVAYFSGLNKSTRDDELAEFNRDGGSKSIIVIQKDAGKEGLSAHDITGKHKRALMIMNTPVSPADAIQMEGRIYRHGLRSDAIIEYPTIQTSFEKIAYRETVSTRTSTAENLAMGSQARNLREAFREGYLDPATADPAETQGTGGRQADQAGEGLSLFGRAKTYYFRRQTKPAAKAAEGTDYFATPEPLGLKMVEWARLEPGERALEPSGGHGAIARWLPESTTNLALEPSGALIGELGIVTTGDVRQMRFEDLNTANKFHAVVMNPPFGRGGTTAIEHIGKAAEHLKDGGRIIAIYPSGPAADGRFDTWFSGTKNLRLAAEIKLPPVTFDRAGTNVATRILVIDKGGRTSDAGTVTHDLSDITDIGQLFDRVEGLELPKRPDLVITAKQVRLSEETVTDDAGRQRWRASMSERFTDGPAGDVGARDVKKLAEKSGGEASTDTSRFWKVTHFDFDTEKDRQRFYASVLDAAEAKAAAAKEAAAEKAGERKFSQTGVIPQALELIRRVYRGAEIGQAIPLGQTPEVARALGLTHNRLVITPDVLWKAVDKHGLTPAEVISALEDAYDPLMVFSHESGSLNAVGRTVDRNGRPIVTAMKTEYLGKRLNFAVTEVSTVHGKDGPEFIGSWIDDGRLQYVDRSGAALWLTSTWANSSRIQSLKSVAAKLAAPQKGILTKDNLRKRKSESAAAAAAGMTAAETRAALRAGPLAPVVERLEKAGVVRIINEAPADVPSTAQGWTDPDGSITLVAGNLTPEQVMPVLLHEAFHSGVKPLVGSRAWDGLLSRLSALHRQQVAGQSAFYDAARRQLERIGVSDALTAEEFGAYAVEAYEAAPQTLRRWVNDVAGVIKAWLLRRFGKQAGQVTPAQLRALAAAALRDMSVRADAPAATGQPAARGRMFSVAGTPGSATTENRIIETIRGAGTDVTPKLLGLVPLNYFSELKRDNMTAVDRYLSTKRAMDAYRGRKHAAADTLAQKWLKYTRTAGGWLKSKESTTRAEALSALMHEATLAGIDPSRTDPEMSDQPGYAALRKRFLDMPQAGRDLFTEVRDFYAQQADELDRLLLENIRKAQAMAEAHAREQHEQDIERIRKSGKTDPELRDAIESANAKYEATRIKSVWANKARLTRMRKSFESNRVPAPYFPLARWGGYFVSVKNAAGDVISFSRRERKVEADRLARDMRAAYPGADIETGVMSKGNGPRDYMDPTMIAEIEQMLGTTSVDEAVKDALWQRYLQTLPDMSVRKRFIHRKGTAGFGADALRGFANAAFHGAHQLARVKYSLDLTNDLTMVTKQAKQADDPVRGMFLANEMADRHKFIMNPTGAKWTQIVNSASFIWMLGLTPAAALINTTQTAMMGIPILGANLGGMTKATAAIGRASKDFAAGKGSVARANLTADERAAMDQANQSGLIDRTQAHDLAGLSESGLRYHPAWAKAMAGISWMYHHAEVFNREVTYLAAYRMARDKGQSHEQAVTTAHDLTWKTHFDYSAASRPRYLQNDAARALLVFQSHTLNMSYRVFRDFHQAFKGESAETRAIARKQLSGIMGMLALFGGVTGMFGFNYMLALAGLVFGDKDDPLDFEAQFKADMLELLGPELGGLVLNGVPGHLTGIDLTSRVGMPYLFIRPQDKEKDGREWFNTFVLGLAGANIGMMANWVDGAQLIYDGNTLRGVEVAAPKAVKDLLKSYRTGSEGLVSRRGDTLVGPEAFDANDLIAQAIGFTPAKVAEIYDRNSALMNASEKVKRQRRRAIDSFALAVKMGDEEARKEAFERIKQFNQNPHHKAYPITQKTLKTSLKARARAAAKREDGVLITPDALGAELRKRLPETVYR